MAAAVTGPAPAGLSATARTRVTRLPAKARRERADLYAVLDAGLVAHLAITGADGWPLAVPVAYARDGDRVLVHGSTASRLLRALGRGQPACLTVTLLDALVVARSAFESSLHYRSAMVLGRASTLRGAAKLDALRVITEHLLPGRWAEVRPPARQELAATTVAAIPLDEASVKVSDGWPADAPADLDSPAWAGVVPFVTTLGAPRPDPALAAGIPVPPSVTSWSRR